MSDKLIEVSDNMYDASDASVMEVYNSIKGRYALIKEAEETKDLDRAEHKHKTGFKKALPGTKKILKTATGISGMQDRKSARNIKESCEKLYKATADVTEYKRNELNERITAFGNYRLEALTRTLGRFLAFLEDMNEKNKIKEYEILDGIGLDTKTIDEMKSIEMSASKALKSSATVGAVGLAAAMGTKVGVTSAIMTYGAASTGTAISSLSGAAASNAVLAWLGGGSLAAGGGGVALGTTVLATAAVGAASGVAIIAAGLMASTHYSKKLTEAKEYQKKVEIDVANAEKMWVLMHGISQRTNELTNLTKELETRILSQFELLEPLTIDFDKGDEYYNSVFQGGGLLIKSMGELSQTPLLDTDGNVSSESMQMISKTRTVLNKNLANYEKDSQGHN